MSGPANVIVLDPDLRAGRQVQLGFAREGIPTVVPSVPGDLGTLHLGEAPPALIVVGSRNGLGPALVRRAREILLASGTDIPILVTGTDLDRGALVAAGADEVVAGPLFLRDVVTLSRLLRNVPGDQRDHLVGSLAETTGVYNLVRALCALGRSAVLTLIRGLRRGEVRFYRGEVTSAQVGLIHGQAALHQLLLWTDARFDFSHEDVVRRQQIPLSPEELFADAERFLEGVRESAGPLSPATVLEPDLQRVQELGKEIPTEVHGVLRMFDGHRVLADILEDSPYRVFETLRVANKALEAGLLRFVDAQRPKASWKAVLAIDEWLVGSETRDAVVERTATIDSGPAPDSKKKTKTSKRRSKKQDAVDAPVERQTGIDWGALVPRTIGAEVGPVAQVVPAVAAHGEVELKSRDVEREKLEALMDTGKRDRIFPRDIGLEPKIIVAPEEPPARASSSDGEDWDKVVQEAKAKADGDTSAPAAPAASASSGPTKKQRRRTAPVVVDIADADTDEDAEAMATTAKVEKVEKADKPEKSKRTRTPAKGIRTRTPPKGVALPSIPTPITATKSGATAATADVDDGGADEDASLWAEARARAEAADEEAARVTAEKVAAEKEKAAAEKLAAEKAAAEKEKAAAEKAAAEQAAAEKLAAEKAAAEKAAAEQAAAEKLAAETAAAEKAAVEKAAAEKLAAEKAAAEKLAAEKLAAEKLAAEKLAAEKAAAEKAAAEKAAAEKLAAETAAAEERALRAEAEYLASKKAAIERAAEEKAEAKRRSDPAIVVTPPADGASSAMVDAGHSTTTRASEAAPATSSSSSAASTSRDSDPALVDKRSAADEARAYAARVKAAAEARRRGEDSGSFEKAPERASLDAESLVKQLVNDAIPPDEQMTTPVPRIESEPTTTPFARTDEPSGPSEPNVASTPATTTAPADSMRAHIGEPITVSEGTGMTVAVADVVTVQASADTASISASPRVLITETPDPTPQVSTATVGEHVIQAAHATSANAASATPVATDDEPSDGIIRTSTGESESARAARLHQVLPPNPPAHDGPEVKEATGEIGAKAAKTAITAPVAEPATSEPSILIADLQAVHAAASAHATDKKPAHPIDAASASRELEIQETRRDAVAFTDDEEAFFKRAESHTHSVPRVESFDDLDEGYEPPPSFWERVFGKKKKK